MEIKKVKCNDLTVEDVIGLLSSYNPTDKVCICGSTSYFAYSGEKEKCISFDVEPCIYDSENVTEKSFRDEKYVNPADILRKIINAVYQPDEVDVLIEELAETEEFSAKEVNYIAKLLDLNY